MQIQKIRDTGPSWCYESADCFNGLYLGAPTMPPLFSAATRTMADVAASAVIPLVAVVALLGLWAAVIRRK